MRTTDVSLLAPYNNNRARQQAHKNRTQIRIKVIADNMATITARQILINMYNEYHRILMGYMSTGESQEGKFIVDGVASFDIAITGKEYGIDGSLFPHLEDVLSEAILKLLSDYGEEIEDNQTRIILRRSGEIHNEYMSAEELADIVGASRMEGHIITIETEGCISLMSYQLIKEYIKMKAR